MVKSCDALDKIGYEPIAVRIILDKTIVTIEFGDSDIVMIKNELEMGTAQFNAKDVSIGLLRKVPIT